MVGDVLAWATCQLGWTSVGKGGGVLTWVAWVAH